MAILCIQSDLFTIFINNIYWGIQEAPEEKVPVISAALITPALPSYFILLCPPVLFPTSLAKTEELFYCSSLHALQRT